MLIAAGLISLAILAVMLISRFTSTNCRDCLIASSGLMLWAVVAPFFKRNFSAITQYYSLAFIVFFTLSADFLLYIYFISLCDFNELSFSVWHVAMPLSGLLILSVLAPSNAPSK